MADAFDSAAHVELDVTGTMSSFGTRTTQKLSSVLDEPVCTSVVRFPRVPASRLIVKRLPGQTRREATHILSLCVLQCRDLKQVYSKLKVVIDPRRLCKFRFTDEERDSNNAIIRRELRNCKCAVRK